MGNAIASLNLNRPQCKRQTSGGVSLCNIEPVKSQLLTEMVALEQHMEALSSDAGALDFSMIQTYKEMIRSRQQFFNELNH